MELSRLNTIAAENGWTQATQIMKLLQFVEDEGMDEELEQYLGVDVDADEDDEEEDDDSRQDFRFVVVGRRGINSAPAMCPVIIAATRREVNLDEHRDAAESAVTDRESVNVQCTFATDEGPDGLFALFEWDDLPTLLASDYV